MNAPGVRPPEDGPVRSEDMEVTLAVRRDLGPGGEDAAIAEFLGRVGPAIDAHVDARLERSVPAPTPPQPPQRTSVVLPIVSLLAGIPITAIVLGITHGSVGGILLMVIVWVAIAGINVAHARGR